MGQFALEVGFDRDAVDGPLSASDPFIGRMTWNNGAVVFETLVLDITNTASAPLSGAINVKVGGVEKFKVKPDEAGRVAVAMASVLNNSNCVALEFFNMATDAGITGNRSHEVRFYHTAEDAATSVTSAVVGRLTATGAASTNLVGAVVLQTKASGGSIATRVLVDDAEMVLAGISLKFDEITEPAAPSSNKGLLFAEDSAGKTRLMVRFPTGASQQIAIEP